MPMSLDPWLLQEIIFAWNHYPSQYNLVAWLLRKPQCQFSPEFSVFAVTILRKLTLQLAQPVKLPCNRKLQHSIGPQDGVAAYFPIYS